MFLSALPVEAQESAFKRVTWASQCSQSKMRRLSQKSTGADIDFSKAHMIHLQQIPFGKSREIASLFAFYE